MLLVFFSLLFFVTAQNVLSEDIILTCPSTKSVSCLASGTSHMHVGKTCAQLFANPNNLECHKEVVECNKYISGPVKCKPADRCYDAAVSPTAPFVEAQTSCVDITYVPTDPNNPDIKQPYYRDPKTGQYLRGALYTPPANVYCSATCVEELRTVASDATPE